MHRYFAAALLMPAALTCSAQEAAVDTHQGIAEALVELLSRTELCLNGCTDAASVQAALPQLQQLAAEAADLSARQKALPEPTVQDYMASQVLAKDFLVLQRAIRQHLDRLQKGGLMTPELREILKTEPENAPVKPQQ